MNINTNLCLSIEKFSKFIEPLKPVLVLPLNCALGAISLFGNCLRKNENAIVTTSSNSVESAQKNSVVYLYWPYVPGMTWGHAKLAINNKTWTIMGPARLDGRSLDDLKANAQKKGKFPLVCFHIMMSPAQLTKLELNVEKTSGITCTSGVANALSKYADFTIPFPFSQLPITSVAYLTCRNKLYSSRVTKIEIFHNHNNHINSMAIINSLFMEIIPVVLLGVILKIIKEIAFDSNS